MKTFIQIQSKPSTTEKACRKSWIHTAWVALDLLKATAILADTTVTRSALDWEDRKTILEIKKSCISLDHQRASYSIYKFLKDVTNRRKKINMVVIFSHTPPTNILKYRYHDWDVPTISKTHIEEFSLFEWKFRFTVLQNHHWHTISNRCLRQIKVIFDLFNQLENYRNIMKFQVSSKGKTGKEISEWTRSEFLEKFFSKHFFLYQMLKTTPLGQWIVEVSQIYLYWKYY